MTGTDYERLREVAERGVNDHPASVPELARGVLALLGERDTLREALDALCAAVEREKRFSLTPSKHFPMSLNVRTSLEAARAALSVGAGEEQ